MEVFLNFVVKQLPWLKNSEEQLEDRYPFGEISEEMCRMFNAEVRTDIAAFEPVFLHGRKVSI